MSTAKVALPLHRELTLTRTFDAPRALVFKMWTDPKHLAEWFGPKDFTNPVCEVDPHPGGRIHVVMHAPWGADYPMDGVFKQVIRPEKIVFTNDAVDQKGGVLIQSVTTVTFEEQDGKTKMTMHTEAKGMVDIAAQMLRGMETGWSQSFDRLADAIARTR